MTGCWELLYYVGMAKRIHDQRPEPRLMTCQNCKLGKCESCVDRLRRIYADDTVCQCTRKLHVEKRDGDMTLNQIEDPETGDIHAPGLIVKADGEVIFRDGFNPFISD